MSAPSLANAFESWQLKLELVEPPIDRSAATLVRLFRHPGADWEPPPEAFRNLRVDPPDGCKGEFSVLYTGDNIAVVAAECRILRVDPDENYTWLRARAKEYKVARYTYSKPAVFIPIDGENCRLLGLAGGTRELRGYGQFQAVAQMLHRRFGAGLHGLSWASFHRNQPGRIYAIWHEHKESIGLTRPTDDFPTLHDDIEWNNYLVGNSHITAIDPVPEDDATAKPLKPSTKTGTSAS
ncbi:hypothetical protein ABH945_003253 [Paraburkholderia sp. GAS333]|uniref:RES domain-containing protein n=1 Tax=Paraburkholderia sp. GAS333 TaxID=3156279 RepID=UPI003D2428A7